MPPFPEIKTRRLLLRNFRHTDVNAVYNFFSNGTVTELYDITTISEYSQAEEIIKNYQSQNMHKSEYGGRWAIVSNTDTSKLIGSCGYHNTDRKNCSIEIGYRLLPDQWNNGYAFEAVSSIIAYCFRHNFPFFLNRITATTCLDSTRSISLLKKLGFFENGTLKEYGYWKENFHDIRCFSLPRHEFFENIADN